MITEYAVPSLALNYHCKKYQIIYESVNSYLCTCMRNKYSCKSEFVWNAHIQVMLKVISIGRFQKISIPKPQMVFRALSDPVLSLLEASVFPLFINFVYNVIVVFRRCLCRRLWLLCWRRCFHCAKQCSLLHGCLLWSASRWILIGILQWSFNGKSSSVRICKHLLCLQFCMV